MRNELPLAAEVRPAEDLTELAASVSADALLFEQTDREQLPIALRIGQKLTKAQSVCKAERCSFTKWLEGVKDLKQRKAYNCIKVYKKREIFARDAKIGYSDALKLAYGVNDAEGEDDESRPPPEYVTAGQWDEAGKDARKKLLKTGGDARFNAQGDNENIRWALWSWNPVTGCLHNCPYCYARDIADRFYEQKFAPSLWPGRLRAPVNTPFPEAKAAEWMGHKNVFVCSMADLFGRWVPSEWIDAVLEQCAAAPRWNFLFLTKFPIRMAEFAFPENAWVGTTVDCQARVANAEKAFRKVKAGVKWLSIEPLIEPLKFSDIGAFQWLVIGGASRSSATPEWRPPNRWVEDLLDAAAAADVPCFEKSNLRRDRLELYPGNEAFRPPEKAPKELQYMIPKDHRE
jgi:protein gp37